MRGGRSEDDRDVVRALRRELKRAGRREGEPHPVQVAAQLLGAEEYAHWRERALRRGTVSSAPALEPGRYALVLFAFAPSATEQCMTEPAVALAGTLAACSSSTSHPSSSRRRFSTCVVAGAWLS